MSYSLSPILLVAAAVPMPGRFAVEWAAVVEAILEFEKPRVTPDGDSGVYRLCGTYKQFVFMHSQALGAKGIGVNPLFQRLREIVATCQAGSSLADQCPGVYIAVSTNYKFRWVSGGADPASFAFRFAADYANIGIARAAEVAKQLRGNGPADSETALLRLDPARGFWNRQSEITEGYCYEYARLIVGAPSDIGGWAALPLPARQFNMFALASPREGKKWHVLGPHETVTGAEVPLGYIEDGSIVGGSTANERVVVYPRFHLAWESDSPFLSRIVNDLGRSIHCSDIQIAVGANRIDPPEAVFDFLNFAYVFQVLSSHTCLPYTTGVSTFHGLWTLRDGYAVAVVTDSNASSMGSLQFSAHYINYSVPYGYSMCCFLSSRDVSFVNGLGVNFGVVCVHSVGEVFAMHVISRAPTFSYALVALRNDGGFVDGFTQQAFQMAKTVCRVN